MHSSQFPRDFLEDEQIVHLTDRTWIKEQTGYILRLRPESVNYRRFIEHYHGYSLTDVQVNQARHAVKPVIKNIVHYYVKIISICMDKADKQSIEDYELPSGDLDPFNYLDVRGFEDYYIKFMKCSIETPYILKTILETMLNKPSNRPIKDTLLYLYKRQPETRPPQPLELNEIWINLVECVIKSYDDIVIDNEKLLPKQKQLLVCSASKLTLSTLSRFDGIISNPIWVNILDSFEEIQMYNSRMKNDTNMPGKIWLRINWYSKGDYATLSFP